MRRVRLVQRVLYDGTPVPAAAQLRDGVHVLDLRDPAARADLAPRGNPVALERGDPTCVDRLRDPPLPFVQPLGQTWVGVRVEPQRRDRLERQLAHVRGLDTAVRLVLGAITRCALRSQPRSTSR